MIATGFFVASGCASRSVAVDDVAWQTRAETTAYEETPTYDETVAYCKKLARASSWVRYGSFGASGRGRDLPLLMLSKNGTFAAKKSANGDLPTVLILNCIHAGECAGKDASLALVRDIAVNKSRADLLDAANILIVPIYNVDGHERRSAFSRINQNGPREMGWRTTARNLNLNRDFAKADAVETQALVRLIRDWQPDVIVDDHTTNGSDHQYDMLYGATLYPPADDRVATWTRAALDESILPAMAAAEFPTMIYAGPRDRNDLSKGIEASVGFSPRYSTGYGAVLNRPTFLLEAHALKPYSRRVRSTYEFLVGLLSHVNGNGAALRTLTRAIDRDAAANADRAEVEALVLSVENDTTGEPFEYRAKKMTKRTSAVSGADYIVYADEPETVATTLYQAARVKSDIAPPAAYVIPPEWSSVAARLNLHGIEMRRLDDESDVSARSYRFRDVTFRDQSFEGRFLPRFAGEWQDEAVTLPAGSFVVPMNQPRAKLAAHLLEPTAPDSFVAWGFFNAIFERKEYAEGYVFAPLAEQMLNEDAALKAEFERKVAEDAEFAANPWARLYFLYDRSEYRDREWMRYPVVRIEDAATRTEMLEESAVVELF